MIDRTTMIGLVATVGLLFWVMVAGAGYAFDVFWQTPSICLVVGGSMLVTIAAFPAARLRLFVDVLRNALFVRTRSPNEIIPVIVALAEIARREGFLALEKPVSQINDDFMKRTMRMVIDGADPNSIESVMNTELESIDLRHAYGKGMLDAMGRAAPVFGMIGTLIGLVLMLGQMSDPAKIGPGMAVALLTTLYGLIVANVFCLPLSKKLAYRNSEELFCKTIVLKGILAVQRGDHPRIVEQKLRAYLPRGRSEQLLGKPLFDWSRFRRSSPKDDTPSTASDRLSGVDETGRKMMDAA